MKRITLCVAIAAMLCALGVAYAQEGDSWADRISVFGYFHGRYMTYESPSQEDGFEFRRMFITLQSVVNDRTTGIVTLSRVGPDDPNIDLYHGFLDYKINDQWNVQVGQVGTWFGLEGWESSSVRLPLERALILEGGPGFYFKGAPERGVWFRRNPATPTEPVVVLGVCNGEFRASDVNTAKNVSIDLKWNQPWGMIGASWLDGTLGQGPNEQPREAVDAYVRLFAPPWGFQAEWADGEMLGSDRDGWYVQGMYAFEDHPGTLFARWEEFNSETSGMTLEQASSTQEYEALHLGYEFKLDDSNELTAQWTDAEWDSSTDASYGGVQWQYSFR